MTRRAVFVRPCFESPSGKTLKSLSDVVKYLANDPSSGAKVEDFFFAETSEAGGLLRTSTRPTLNLLLLLRPSV